MHSQEQGTHREVESEGSRLSPPGVITDRGRDCLTDILMDLVLPCNIFLSFPSDTDRETLRGFLVTIAISVFVMLLTALLGKILYHRREARQEKVFRYGLVNSNALFIGLPIVQSLLGDAGGAPGHHVYDLRADVLLELRTVPVHRSQV